ncbi:MAG: CTP synthase [Candidatus Eisenbacteria bacterium]|uniref:CTP synthase n=1 Tax=Eiseniibacteriota bacterium TaxID=2212470 RepID=A0A948RTQ6_UNCEI|nr:CTP synthase [Candidatus Eisenbacteria bacterium]MBU1947935.1 CTP synthase [Candidatus Eisenbacteria bacterium]MBU2689821.1 CTP synthase [Candidatus Eisenbacteria bacterium]
MRERHFIFITGGVVSSLGKGIAAASLGLLLKERGLKVTLQKFDPYLNVDPGTMSPYQHGEVFVTDDGAETDLDLGHYERFTGLNLGQANNVTAGQIYDTVITRERRGDYLGKTVQVIPHVTDEIKHRMVENAAASDADVSIIEIGGTVGDIESLPFLEAIRQLRLDLGREHTLFIHLTLVPYIKAAGEYKTKPTQHSVKGLREIGIQPDILLCRCEEMISRELREKIALFCNVSSEAVIPAVDVASIYEVPLHFHAGGLDRLTLSHFQISAGEPKLESWEELVSVIKGADKEVVIAVCGKYTYLHDAYKSLVEALVHGATANRTRVRIRWVESNKILEDGAEANLLGIHGLLVPGGFGQRGIEGMIQAIQYARENRIPFFGICLGMHCSTIEFARNVSGMEDANSTEFNPDTPYPVISLLPEQRPDLPKGGTMRLGGYLCRLDPDSQAREAYGSDEVQERHRHRYEFNNAYLDTLAAHGLRATGIHPENNLVEIIELDDHPWYVAVQFHPELKSRPRDPHPLFKAFIAASVCHSKSGACVTDVPA